MQEQQQRHAQFLPNCVQCLGLFFSEPDGIHTSQQTACTQVNHGDETLLEFHMAGITQTTTGEGERKDAVLQVIANMTEYMEDVVFVDPRYETVMFCQQELTFQSRLLDDHWGVRRGTDFGDDTVTTTRRVWMEAVNKFDRHTLALIQCINLSFCAIPNPVYVQKMCAPSCRSCHRHRCPAIDRTLPVALSTPFLSASSPDQFYQKHTPIKS